MSARLSRTTQAMFAALLVVVLPLALWAYANHWINFP